MASDRSSNHLEATRLLGQGDFSGARAMLRLAVEGSSDPETRLLLGQLAFVAADFAEARDQLERAYHGFLDAELRRRAAMAASALTVLHTDGLEEPAIGRVWLQRALRLLEDEEPCVERGYVLLGLMGASVASADELAVRSREALNLAHGFKDRALECKALGDWGLALVSMGAVDDGMSKLDEACTMIMSGECTDPAVSSVVLCGMLSACDRCGDVARAESWLRYIEDATATGLRAAAAPTLAHCWSAFGSVLCNVGRYQEGETALRMALATGDASFRHVKLATRAVLADLWIRQGRLSEASRLLEHDVDRVEIQAPRARLYLAQKRYDLATAMARNALRGLSGDRLRAAPLLLVVVEAELGSGNRDGAHEAAVHLTQVSDRVDVPAVAAHAALGNGKVAAAAGDKRAAAEHLEDGLGRLTGENWPLLRAALHLELARVAETDRPADALVAAEAALALYQRVGAPEARAAAILLRRLGRSVGAAPPPPRALDVLSAREREVLSCLAQGLTNPEIATKLFITAKTAEHHVSSILGKLGLRNRTEAAAFGPSFSISPA
ncbi:MAG TPA: LuxR C-terminal-related transcriptional regulator [Candidatus Dormibacteraeota bacterium]